MTEPADKADLIRHALGSGLQGLLPGQDNQAAIKARGSDAAWHGSEGSGRVTRAGIAWWAPERSWSTDKPDVTLTWREILDVIHRGCVDGNRETYETAWTACIEQSSTPLPEPWIPACDLAARGLSTKWFYESEANQEHWAKTSRVGRELREAADAIVATGVSRGASASGAVVSRDSLRAGQCRASSFVAERRSATAIRPAPYRRGMGRSPSPLPASPLLPPVPAVALCSGREGGPHNTANSAIPWSERYRPAMPLQQNSSRVADERTP